MAVAARLLSLAPSPWGNFVVSEEAVTRVSRATPCQVGEVPRHLMDPDSLLLAGPAHPWKAKEPGHHQELTFQGLFAKICHGAPGGRKGESPFGKKNFSFFPMGGVNALGGGGSTYFLS